MPQYRLYKLNRTIIPNIPEGEIFPYQIHVIEWTHWSVGVDGLTKLRNIQKKIHFIQSPYFDYLNMLNIRV